MKIAKILGENGPMLRPCKSGACPAILITDGEDVLVQGRTVEDGELLGLDLPSGECVVRLSRTTLEKLLRQLAES